MWCLLVMFLDGREKNLGGDGGSVVGCHMLVRLWVVLLELAFQLVASR